MPKFVWEEVDDSFSDRKRRENTDENSCRGKDNHTMQNLKYIPFLLASGTVILSLLYMKTSYGVLLSLAITFGTMTYHFAMRLLTGLVFSIVMNNRADYRKKWFQVSKFEMALYHKLKVKTWKQKISKVYL